MKMYSDSRFYFLLTVAFTLIVTSFSFNLTDFNHTKDLILATVLCIMVLRLLVRPPDAIVFPTLSLVAVPIVIVYTLWHGDESIPLGDISLGATTHYLLALLFLFYIVNTIPLSEQPHSVRALLTGSSIVVALMAWVQYFNITSSIFPVYPNYNQAIYSVFGNQNLLGGYIAITIPMLVHRITRCQKPDISSCVLLVFLILTCLISGSRSAWLAAVIASLMIIPYRSLVRSHYVLTGILTIIVLAISHMNQDATLNRILHTFTTEDIGFNTRTWIWSGSLLLIKEHFWLGVGPGMFQYHSPYVLGEILQTSLGVYLHPNEIHTLLAHSSPLDLVIEFGITGIAPSLAWLFMLSKGSKNEAWGSALALTVFGTVNSILTSTPHLLIAILLFTTLYSPGVSVKVKPAQSRILISLVAFIVLLPTIVVFTVAIVNPSFQLAKARNSFARQEPQGEILEKYELATDMPRAFHQAHLEFGLLLLETSPEEAGKYLGIASNGIDTGELHLALGQAHHSVGSNEAALHHTQLGLYRWPSHPLSWIQLLTYSDQSERKNILERSKNDLTPRQHEELTVQFGDQ